MIRDRKVGHTPKRVLKKGITAGIEKSLTNKYQDLRIKLRRLWDKLVEIVPIIIWLLGTIPKSLKRNLEELGADVAPGLLQKSVVLETSHIIRRVMDS